MNTARFLMVAVVLLSQFSGMLADRIDDLKDEQLMKLHFQNDGIQALVRVMMPDLEACYKQSLNTNTSSEYRRILKEALECEAKYNQEGPEAVERKCVRQSKALQQFNLALSKSLAQCLKTRVTRQRPSAEKNPEQGGISFKNGRITVGK